MTLATCTHRPHHHLALPDIYSHSTTDLHTIAMYLISVEDEDTHPASDVSDIRKSVRKCLEEKPEYVSSLKRSLSELLGEKFPQIFINKIEESYFIIFSNENCKPLHVWAIKKENKPSLREDCIMAISDWILNIEDIEKLGLPKPVEFDLADFYQRTMILLREQKYSVQCNLS